MYEQNQLQIGGKRLPFGDLITSFATNILLDHAGSQCLSFAKNPTAFRINRIACCPGPKLHRRRSHVVKLGCCNIVTEIILARDRDSQRPYGRSIPEPPLMSVVSLWAS